MAKPIPRLEDVLMAFGCVGSIEVMYNLRCFCLLQVFLFGSVGGALAQNSPPEITNTTLGFEVNENDWAEFFVDVRDTDGDSLTLTFTVASGHSIDLDVTSKNTGSSARVFNKFIVPAGSKNSTIEIEAALTDGVIATPVSQIFSFPVVGINHPPISR